MDNYFNFGGMSLLQDLVKVFYPPACYGCGKILVTHEYFICSTCELDLPVTDFNTHPDNAVMQQLWGKAKVESAQAYLYFQKSGITQNLMHHLKYRGVKSLGVFLGERYADTLIIQPDYVIPVPLHKKKLKKRGYNQSELFAKGLTNKLGCRLMTDNLYRTRFTETQTNKSRYERWENVKGVFALKQPELLEGKTILLVDDVVTTGATLIACAEVLNQVPECKVHIATIAYAVDT